MKDAASLDIKEVFEALETSPKGLTSEEAKKRLTKYGLNILVEKRRTSIAYKFLMHLKDLFSVLLIFASVLSAIVGMWDMSSMILAVVIVNTIFSLFQEWRAEKAMETLKSWMPEYAKVFRDGELKKILVRELVPGDVILLEEGDRVPADSRLVQAFDLWTNNVPLTGESEPQPRTTEPVVVEDNTYLDVPNLVFMSTSISKGQGKAVVTKTGKNTKFGQIASLTLEIKDPPSPLQKEIAYTAKYDLTLAVTVGIIFFAMGYLWLHITFIESVLFMIGVMVACVPEGLQVTVSSALAINVLKMLKENVLVKRLSSVQTLGSVTVICTDKTGTITKGEMTVRKIWIPDTTIEVSGVGHEPIGEFTEKGNPLTKDEANSIEKLLEISALCNGAKIEPPSDTNRSWNVVGDPTDGALLVAALKYGINIKTALVQNPVVHVIAFDSARKRMTTIHRDGRKIAFTKGAPRSILSICDQVLNNGKIEPLVNDKLRTVEFRIRELAEEGLRVIAIAYRQLEENENLNEHVERNMIFVGLAAMKDPPRPEVKEAVRSAKQASIKIVIITGDYGPTAQAIAEEVEIVAQKKARIIRGVDLEAKSDREIVNEVREGNVIFARVSPEQKLRIIKILKAKGEIVAVTGDGANDAPSLREADIGVAMGTSGTDVAREASDMVLLDDSFASIVKAVESGRTIYENLRKFIVYVFAHNFAELVPYLLYVILGIPLPLLVIHVLAIDLGIDVIPSLALSREPAEIGIMEEPPRSVDERLFSGKVFLRSLYVGLIIATGAMIGCLNAWKAGGWYLGGPNPSDLVYLKGITMTFAGIVIGQVGNVIACRTSRVSVFKTSVKSNKWIWVGITFQLAIISSIIYVPFLQGAFQTTSIDLVDWIYLALIALLVIFIEEIRKAIARRLSG